MDARTEMHELERLWEESPQSSEFSLRQRNSKWGERIREAVVKGIEKAQPEAIEDGMLYLEVNPRYFRSGYHKAIVASKLKSARLTEQQRARLRRVILTAAVDPRVGPEFNEYARLAVRVADADFLAQVEDRRKSSRGWSRSRLSQILMLCKKHKTPINME